MKISIQLICCLSMFAFCFFTPAYAQLDQSNSKLGSSANTLAQKSVSLPGPPMSVTFSNQMDTSVTAYWVDFNGLNQQIATLFPKQAVQMTTYPGHITVFMANGKQVAKFEASAAAKATAYAIMGPRPSTTNTSGIPQTTTTIPAAFKGPNGTLISPQLLNGNLNRKTNMRQADIGNFIKSLATVIKSPSNPGIATSNQFARPNQLNQPNTLAAFLNNLAKRPKITNTSTSTNNNLSSNTNTNNNSTAAPAPANISSIESEVLKATNQERAKLGLGAVANSAPAANLSRQHSKTQLGSGSLSHDGMEQRLKASASTMGIPYKGGTENVAQNNDKGSAQATAKALVDSWMTSPGHKRNILDPNAKHLGVGITINPANGQVWATQLFLY